MLLNKRMCKFVFVISLVLPYSYIYAKKDFYYNYVDNHNEQVSNQLSREAKAGALLLDEVQKDLDNNKLLDARAKIIDFKSNNKIKVLKPRGEYLYALVALRQQDPFAVGESIENLNSLISHSLIKNKELLKVMYVLSQLNMFANNEKQATYWAKNIFKTFDSKQAHILGYESISKIYYKQQEHKHAISVLKKAITKLKDEPNSAILFSELYSHLVAIGKYDKATKIAKVLINNHISYYSNNIQKVKETIANLRDNGNKAEAAEFLEILLQADMPKKYIDYIRFELANTYMAIDTKDNEYRKKAKELYEQIMVGNKKNQYYKMSKLRRDEVLMLEDKLSTKEFYKRYTSYDFHRQKAIVYDRIVALRSKKYKELLAKRNNKLPDSIFKNYGYKSQKDFYDLADKNMVSDAIQGKYCSKLVVYTKSLDIQKVSKILKTPSQSSVYSQCMLQTPDMGAYMVLKYILKDTKSANVLFFLERMALSLGRYNEAYNYSTKIHLLKDQNVASQEILYALEILMHLDTKSKYDKFFKYNSKHPQYENENQEDIRIVDYYYYYYHYLMRRHQDEKAFAIIKKLYDAQIKFDVFIYSPFVEITLASTFYMNNGYKNTLEVIKNGFAHADKIDNEDLIQMYYYKAKSYLKLKDIPRSKKYAIKCLKVGIKSMYKNLCKPMAEAK